MTSDWKLPPDIVSRNLRVNDLDMHVLEAGDLHDPLIILLHGFPELSYSWRRVISPLASAGFHVVAPDQRGYGRTTMLGRSDPSKPIGYDEDIHPFRILNLTKDIIALVYALGCTKVHAVVGHNFGSPVAGHCALIRPDMFQRVVMMSAPFTGPPSYPLGGAVSSTPDISSLFAPIQNALAQLDPPRKHYIAYFSSPNANDDLMMRGSKTLKEFLRAYYHVKSADWAHDDPHPLLSLSAESLATLPEYYVMRLERTMPETVVPQSPSQEEVLTNDWLPDSELDVYVTEYGRTGFQGGLNEYRCMTDGSGRSSGDLLLFSGKKGRGSGNVYCGEKRLGDFSEVREG
ncbi:hypothetical protein EW146_g1860 [Bondarzewia mesenterica]|uniref:AB hydrolase-1 domain-containing protein n=1 Tax=Bondarzewia mesenterica TaxID=1095465 RepID=A0A4S4M2I3_9AGAM|nr:hypothetical protein EW146_g1860 [Bondarzewia mesenterica]